MTTAAATEILILVCIFGIPLLVLLAVLVVSRVRVYGARRKALETQYGVILRDETAFIQAAHANIDAVTAMIYELSTSKTLSEYIPEETATALYNAHRKVQTLRSIPEVAKKR